MTSQQNTTSFSFENLDLFSFNKIAQEWDLEFIQFKPAKLEADLNQIIGNSCQLGHVKFNAAIKQEGVSPIGVWTFAFVNEVEFFWRNNKVQPHSIIIYAPGSTINAINAPNFEVVTFSVVESVLNEIASEMKEEVFYESLKTIDLMKTHYLAWTDVRKVLLNQISIQIQNPGTEIDKKFINSFTKNLLGLLKGSTISTDKVSSNKRLYLLQTAEHFMLKNLAEPISVLDIANHCAVSIRMLQYAFRERFSMGPKAFLSILKLNDVYHNLHKNSTDISIASIARESEFWHMGQFYKDYKKFFGELPSHTLKRSTT